MLHLVTSKNPIHHADKGLEDIEGLFTDLTSTCVTIRLKLNNSLRNVIIIYIITFINSAACVIFGCSNIKADK